MSQPQSRTEFTFRTGSIISSLRPFAVSLVNIVLVSGVATAVITRTIADIRFGRKSASWGHIAGWAKPGSAYSVRLCWGDCWRFYCSSTCCCLVSGG